jgi:hypothetical protein
MLRRGKQETETKDSFLGLDDFRPGEPVTADRFLIDSRASHTLTCCHAGFTVHLTRPPAARFTPVQARRFHAAGDCNDPAETFVFLQQSNSEGLWESSTWWTVLKTIRRNGNFPTAGDGFWRSEVRHGESVLWRIRGQRSEVGGQTPFLRFSACSYLSISLCAMTAITFGPVFVSAARK